MVGTALIGVGSVLFGYGAIESYFENKNKRVDVGTTKDLDRTKNYTLLFEHLGLMDGSKGDWIKCLKVEVHKNYKLVKFKISDTLSVVDFMKAIERIKEKMQVKHLEIYAENGIMHLRVRNEVLELESYSFAKTKKYLVPLGLDMNDTQIEWDLRIDPHMLICGSTGCGKSRLLHSIINHIYNNTPKSSLYLVDLKRGIEFSQYERTKNCASYAELLGDVKQVIADFDNEQERRYAILKEKGYRDYNEYIADNPQSKLQRCYLIIDEVADIMALNKSTKKEEYNVMDVIIEIARKCRCLGMHIICATQRPTTNFISSDLKANLSCILGMRTMNELNSRLIIDENGCEELNRAEAIGIIGSKKIFFRAYNFNPTIIQETVKKFEKPPEEPKTEPPKKTKKKSPIKK